ncbi:hypothetical protein [Fructobacillus durionis]|uniref:Uncharacterized protein n=1 Tax=Fructobacillus durionis TaxID=283737 RepID=A0A1I1DYA1_9LACO|nr:hypothetical protein [Fructobacillus durionis]SFB77690.1 hypothetical protein SAMN05660453_0099 [Fructobacillus durionis]
MELKQYDYVKLKDGREGFLVEIWSNETGDAMIEVMDQVNLGYTIGLDDIKPSDIEVVLETNHPAYDGTQHWSDEEKRD